MSNVSAAPVVKAAVLAGIDAFLSVRGINADAYERMLEQAGLAHPLLDDSDTMVPLNAVARFLNAAAVACDDPCLGLHWGEELPKGATGVVGYLIMNARSVRTALAAIARYHELQLSPIEVQFTEADDVGRLEWRFPSTFTEPRVQFSSFAMAATINRLRFHAGALWCPMSVELDHRALACTEDVLRVFGPGIHYDRPANAILIRGAVLDRGSNAVDHKLFLILRDLAERLLAEQHARRDIVHKTENAIINVLQRGDVSLDDVANDLEMTTRTLQHNLSDAETNFENVLHETRRRLAETYLRDTDLPLTEIAFLLGFSELSSFTRAANRWFGVPPRQRRQDLRKSA